MPLTPTVPHDGRPDLIANTGIVDNSAASPERNDTNLPQQPNERAPPDETTAPNCEDEGASEDASLRADPEVILIST